MWFDNFFSAISLRTFISLNSSCFDLKWTFISWKERGKETSSFLLYSWMKLLGKLPWWLIHAHLVCGVNFPILWFQLWAFAPSIWQEPFLPINREMLNKGMALSWIIELNLIWWRSIKVIMTINKSSRDAWIRTGHKWKRCMDTIEKSTITETVFNINLICSGVGQFPNFGNRNSSVTFSGDWKLLRNRAAPNV